MINLFPLEVSVLSSNALCDYITKEYFLGSSVNCRLFYRGLHDVYIVTTDNKEYFFKVYRQGLRRMEEVQSEVDLLNHLELSGIESVLPVVKSDGKYISQFHTVNGVRYGVLYSSVGLQDFNQIEETADLNIRLGKYIASIHNAWDQSNFVTHRWNIDEHSFIDHSINNLREFSINHHIDIGFLEEVATSVKRQLNFLSKEKPKYGVCHGDIYSGNIRLDSNQNPILFDFDFCGNGWRAYDISMYAFPFGMGSDITELKKREQRKNQFLNGYNMVRAMSDDEINSIALFIPFRRIFNMGTLYISFLSNTWGESLVIKNIDEDIKLLKKWVELNPVL